MHCELCNGIMKTSPLDPDEVIFYCTNKECGRVGMVFVEVE